MDANSSFLVSFGSIECEVRFCRYSSGGLAIRLVGALTPANTGIRPGDTVIVATDDLSPSIQLPVDQVAVKDHLHYHGAVEALIKAGVLIAEHHQVDRYFHKVPVCTLSQRAMQAAERREDLAIA